MNIILTLASCLIFFGFSLLPAQVHAAANTYYVTQNGNGAKDGKSLANAWSISDFNSLRGTGYAGSTFYFSGTISSLITVGVSGTAGGGHVTLDGYRAGDCDPLNSECTSSALMTNGIRLPNGNSYVRIQDFRGSGGSSTSYPFFHIGNAPTSHIEIKRNYIHDTVLSIFCVSGASSSQKADDIIIEGNKFVNFGKSYDSAQGINVVRTRNLIFRNNIMGHSGATKCTSANVVELHQSRYVLVENNEIYGAPQQAGIAAKEYGNQDVIIRYNYIHDNDGYSGRGIGVNWPTTERIYIYGNVICRNGDYGIDVFDAAHHVYIWSNYIYDHPQRAIITWWVESRGTIMRDKGYSYQPIHDLYIIDNVFANNGTGITDSSEPSWTGLALGAPSTSTVVKNNIFYNNRPNSSTNQQVYVGGSSVGGTVFEHNQYYYDGKSPIVYWGNKYLTLQEFQALGSENDNPQGQVAAITKNDDYTRLSSLPGAESSGLVGQVMISGTNYALYYRDGLNPSEFDFSNGPSMIGHDHNTLSPPSALKIIKIGS